MEKYYLIYGKTLVKGVIEAEVGSLVQAAFEFDCGTWKQIDVNRVNDRLMGYDPSEGIGCTSVMDTIEEITLEEAENFIKSME